MTHGEEHLKIEQDIQALAELIYDIYVEKKQSEASNIKDIRRYRMRKDAIVMAELGYNTYEDKNIFADNRGKRE